MKITKTEKIWLALTVIFYVLYNFPGIPGYYDPKGLIIHALLTVLPLWIVVYVGLIKVLRKYRIKK